jgi:hypothetical protein
MRTRWPDFAWHQNAADFTLSRGVHYKGKGVFHGADLTKALRWYWTQLAWRREGTDGAADVGVSWRELAIDFWCATGVIARFPRNKRTGTTLQHLSEAFASASRALEKEEKDGGGWLWQGTCGRTSSLAPLGQKAAVTGLSVRPRLLCCVEVGLHLCRLAAAAARGDTQEEVENWLRRQPPCWRRWRPCDGDTESE